MMICELEHVRNGITESLRQSSAQTRLDKRKELEKRNPDIARVYIYSVKNNDYISLKFSTIWNNKNGKAVFAEQVFDRCQRKFQDEINRELYKLIEEGGGGGTGKDGQTPVLKAGEITSLPYGAEPTFKLVYEGNNHEGNPVYRMDLGLPQGKPGEDGNDGDDGISQIKVSIRSTPYCISQNNIVTLHGGIIFLILRLEYKVQPSISTS